MHLKLCICTLLKMIDSAETIRGNTNYLFKKNYQIYNHSLQLHNTVFKTAVCNNTNQDTEDEHEFDEFDP